MVHKAIHFDGCGAAFAYTVGFCVYLDHRFKNDETMHYTGVSSGAWIATAKVLDIPLEECINLAIELQDRVRNRKLGLIGEFKGLLREYYEKLCPKNTNYKTVNRIHIRITESNFRTYFINNFHSRGDLIECLLASQHIPFLLDYKPYASFRGSPCFDGQWVKQKTRVQCPEYFEVTPLPKNPFKQKFSPWKAVTVKSQDEIEKLLNMGYDTARQNHFELLNLGFVETDAGRSLKTFVNRIQQPKAADDTNKGIIIQEKAA